MSESSRPRRSAATASSKVWAPLMSNKGGEEDVYDDIPDGHRKRTASKETPPSMKSPVQKPRGKKAKMSESTDSETVVSQSMIISVVETEPMPVLPRNPSRSPKKPAASAKTAPIAVIPSADLSRMEEDFDRQHPTIPVDEVLEEEEAPPVITKPPPKPRGRASQKAVVPPPSLTGMDDPKDADYVFEEEKKPSKPTPKTRMPSQPIPRPMNMIRAVPPRPIAFRPPIGPRVVYPQRIPTIVNGGPRVVQPRYSHPIRPVQNPDMLTKPMPVQNYDPPQSVLNDIDRLTNKIKEHAHPSVASAFELIHILREELDRSQKAYADSTQYYQDYVEKLQQTVSNAEEESIKRIRSLEHRVSNLEGQLKKASAVAHQKLLKNLDDGHTPQKIVPQQYVVVGGESSSVDQHPTNYLVQEEEYTAVGPQGSYYHHEAVIQEASKEVDNMM